MAHVVKLNNFGSPLERGKIEKEDRELKLINPDKVACVSRRNKKKDRKL